MNVKHYVGEYGSEIILDTGEDLSGATVYIVGKKVYNNESIEWGATVYDTTKVKYTTQSGDFDKADIYRIQAKVVAANGTWYGETVDLLVYALND